MVLFALNIRYVCLVTTARNASTAPADLASLTFSPAAPRRARRAGRATAALLGAVLVLAGCVSPADKVQTEAGASPSPDATATSPTLPTDGIPDELRSFYEQTTDWTPCAAGFECADVTVPLDWDDPTGQTLAIAAKRRPANETKMGTILINPGGPGGSGLEFVDYVPFIFGTPLLDNFDILGFDPRGVGESGAVTCLTDAERDVFNAAT